MPRWTGNGVANGTAVTNTAQINTAGNGDAISAWSPSGTWTATYAGDGLDVSGASGSIARIDRTITAARSLRTQVFFTPGAVNVSQLIFEFRHSTNYVARLNIIGDGRFAVYNAAGALLADSGVTAVAGHRYKVDFLVTQDAGTRSTTNGRVVVLIKSLNSGTWNTTGEWFYDSGYTANVGTADIASFRTVKVASEAVTVANRYEQIGWTEGTVSASDTSRPAIEAYFLPDPYAVTAVMNAGPDQSNVEPYTTVTLDSSASTGSSARTWTQTGGTTVTLSSTSATSPTFKAPGTLNGTTLTFRVTDNATSVFDDVTVTVLRSALRMKVGGVIVPIERRMKVA